MRPVLSLALSPSSNTFDYTVSSAHSGTLNYTVRVRTPSTFHSTITQVRGEVEQELNLGHETACNAQLKPRPDKENLRLQSCEGSENQ